MCVIDNNWVSASAIRNYLLGDPILDWLQLWPENHNYQPDHLHPNYSSDTDFNIFLNQQAIRFEKHVFFHFQNLYNTIQIAHTPNDIKDRDKAKQTEIAIKNQIPVIYQGVLHDSDHQTFGSPDFIVRTDILDKLFPGTLDTKEISHSDYRIIDVKFTTLRLLKNGFINNGGAMLILKAQLYIYNQALSSILGYRIPRSYILGRSWKHENNYGNSCLDKIAPVLANEIVKNNTKLSQLVNKSVQWVRRVRSEGQQWSLFPEPTVSELYPNMGNQEDAPWRQSKKDIAKKLEELTLLWKVGLNQRNAAHQNALLRWTDSRITAETLGLHPRLQTRSNS